MPCLETMQEHGDSNDYVELLAINNCRSITYIDMFECDRHAGFCGIRTGSDLLFCTDISSSRNSRSLQANRLLPLGLEEFPV